MEAEVARSAGTGSDREQDKTVLYDRFSASVVDGHAEVDAGLPSRGATRISDRSIRSVRVAHSR
jgi:hypothetical protein